MTIQPGTDIGRYHILEQLGAGGMAVVYKAYDTRLENEVAVKFIRVGDITANALPRILKRFQIEAKKMAQLTHPNIIRVLDYGEFEGTPYLVMPYIPGGTLKAFSKLPLPVSQAAGLLLPVAEALSYAHSKGLVHRDIKPSNILITESGKPMLSDFGVAKVLESDETLDLTTTGMGVGTPEYMAPEQAEGKPIDARADIYSLGIVLYELLTGRKPFTADTPMAVIVKQMHDPLPDPSVFVAGIPLEVQALLFKVLAKKPEDRCSEMSEFTLALKKLAESQSFTPSASSDKHKKQFPLRWVGIAGGLLILALLAGLFLRRTDLSLLNPAAPTVENETARIRETDNSLELLIPSGEFEMGSNDGDTDEKPLHKVYLDAYWIDKTEVTNAQYQLCLDTGACTSPKTNESYSRENYFDSEAYADYPVIHMEWYQARDYCRWAGGRLPSEAEWEKAAKGEDGHIYPWGNSNPGDSLLNYNNNKGDTTPVGSYPAGASPYGVLDMAGNVLEWVEDWYREDYYSSKNDWINPQGPSYVEWEYRLLRGGSWSLNYAFARSSDRVMFNPSLFDNIGFRCARDVK